MSWLTNSIFSVCALVGTCLTTSASGAEVKLLTRPPDPYGAPRPRPDRSMFLFAPAFTSSWG